MTDQQPHDQQQPWDECPSGELSRMARRLQSQHQRRLLAKVSTTSVLLVAVVVIIGGLTLTTGRSPYAPGGITCLECQAQFVVYHQHVTEEGAWDSALAEQMETHLEHCGTCRGAFDGKYPGVLSGQIAIQSLAGFDHPTMRAASVLLAAAWSTSVK